MKTINLGAPNIDWLARHTIYNWEVGLKMLLRLSCFEDSLTLFASGGGAHLPPPPTPPCHVFAFICANTPTTTLKKLDSC